MGFSSAVVVILICILGPALVQAEELTANRAGHVAIVSDFPTPISITCYSYLMTRQTYTASRWDDYTILFNTGDGFKFWDCQLYNRESRAVGVFRFYGDATHGGPQLWNCEHCIWKVDHTGIYFYNDGTWQFKYHWPHRIKI